jgi:hypothetical protein
VELNLYQQILGSLLYLALENRPVILTAVCLLSRFTSAPTKYCDMGVNRVFRYLQGTIYLALEYCSSDIKMNVFLDSDYAGDTNSRKSPSVMALFLGSSLIQWHPKKQSAVSLSTCEAEYRTMTEATKDPILFKRILEEPHINVAGLSLCTLITSRQLNGQLRTNHRENVLNMLTSLSFIFGTWLKTMGLPFHMLPLTTTSQMDSQSH